MNWVQKKKTTQNTSVNSKFLHKISEKELSAAIKNLKKYTSDYDGLNIFMPKKNKFAIVPTLTYLVKKCFQNSVFPNSIKKALIIPLFKTTGDPRAAEIYRPISLLPTIGTFGNNRNNRKIQTTEQKSFWVLVKKEHC